MLIDARHVTMMRARITAYSTAVGPSSRRRNFRTQVHSERMARIPGSAAALAWPARRRGRNTGSMGLNRQTGVGIAVGARRGGQPGASLQTNRRIGLAPGQPLRLLRGASAWSFVLMVIGSSGGEIRRESAKAGHDRRHDR